MEALLLREVEPLLTATLVLLDGGVPKDSSLSLDVVLLADSSLLLGGEVELPKNSSRLLDVVLLADSFLLLGGEVGISDGFSFTQPASCRPWLPEGDPSPAPARATRTGPLGEARGGKLKCLESRVSVRGRR